MNHFDKMKKEIKMKPRGLKNFKKCLFRRDLKQSVMILFAGILLMALSAYAYDPLPVQYEKLEHNTWCGAASVTAVAIRYGEYPSGFGGEGQCVVQNYIKNRNDCCNIPIPKLCDAGMTRADAVDAYNELGLSATDYDHGGCTPGLSEQQIENEIADGRPFNIHWGRYLRIVDVCYCNTKVPGGHWVVGTGWFYHPLYMTNWMWYMNVNGISSGGGHWAASYQVMKYGEDDECRRWSKSITIDDDDAGVVPDDVMLIKTRQDNNYTFISEGDISAEEFEIKDNKTIFQASGQIRRKEGFRTFRADNDAGFEAEIIP